MQENDIHGADAGKAFSDALAHNTVLQELDLSKQAWGTSESLDAAFTKEFAVGLSTNGALTSMDISANSLGGYDEEDEFGNEEWISEMSGIKALAVAIPECK